MLSKWATIKYEIFAYNIFETFAQLFLRHKDFTLSGFANRTTPHPTTQTLFPNVLAALFLTGG